MGNVLLVAALAFVGLMVGLQVLARSRARAMQGKDVPELSGPLGRQLTGAPRALLYFFSPSCGACRALTPRFAALSRSNPAVHLVDVAQDLGVARSFHVMGTPSVIEIAEGKIVGYHVGTVPAEVMARFA
jgi:thioredoxin 1